MLFFFRTIIPLFLLFCAHWAIAQNMSNQTYRFSMDIRQAKEDMLRVSLLCPPITKDEISYFMPKIVPGTYNIYDFGRFLSDFTAEDAQGNKLPVEQKNENEWRIKNAKNLHKISYIVEDSYDTEKENFVFEPAGTNIENNKNFVINTHGFFGYLEDMKRIPYEISITRPENFYGSTALKARSSTPDTDVFSCENYNELVDSPMMYNKPDTTTLYIGGAEILVSVYSPNKIVASKELAEKIKRTLEAQKEYLGGKLPIQKYAFIIYLYEGLSGSGSYGALEHSYSSFYFLPEEKLESIAKTVIEVSAHEFFHIITPLTIHSEEIHYFDFNAPKMSRHLWLYEGVTEYFANHVLVNQKVFGVEDFFASIRQKVFNSKERYNDEVSFTEFSLGCLDKYQEDYGNVYEKGALIGLCVDLKLRILSNGQYGIRQVFKKLSELYGKDKAFKDEELFDKITELTYPEMRTFFADYVEGNKPLPLQELLQEAGITYSPEYNKESLAFSGISWSFNDQRELYVEGLWAADDFVRKMGIKQGDVIIALNGSKVTQENAKQLLDSFVQNTKKGQKITVVVKRKEKKKWKEKTLSANAEMTIDKEYHYFDILPTPTEKQLNIRNTWLYGN